MSNANWPPDARPRSEPEPADYFPQASETHLRDYWYLILKRRWLILAVLVCSVSYSAARALMRKPVYTASSVLQIDRGKINLVQDVMTPDYWSGYNEFYPTQQRVLRSRNLARRVVNQLRLWEHPYFTGGHKLEADEQTLKNLSGAVVGMLLATQIKSTQLMEIRFTSLDPKLSADLSNALAQQYISFHSETVTTLARDTAGFIGEQIEKIQQDIQKHEKLLQEYSQREDLMMVGEKELIVMRELEKLNTAVTQARTARAVAEANYRNISAARASTLPGVQQSPTIRSLLEQRGFARRNVAELSSKFKDDWPELRRARETLAEIDERVQVEEAAVARKLVAQSRVELNAARERESLLLEEAQSQKREAQELNKLTANYKQIKAEVDNQRSMLTQLLRRQSETGLSADLGERQPVNVRIVEAALVPRAPTGPGLSRNLFLGHDHRDHAVPGPRVFPGLLGNEYLHHRGFKATCAAALHGYGAATRSGIVRAVGGRRDEKLRLRSERETRRATRQELKPHPFGASALAIDQGSFPGQRRHVDDRGAFQVPAGIALAVDAGSTAAHRSRHRPRQECRQNVRRMQSGDVARRSRQEDPPHRRRFAQPPTPQSLSLQKSRRPVERSLRPNHHRERLYSRRLSRTCTSSSQALPARRQPSFLVRRRWKKRWRSAPNISTTCCSTPRRCSQYSIRTT